MAEPPCTICGAQAPAVPSVASTLAEQDAIRARLAELRAWLVQPGPPDGDALRWRWRRG